MKRRIKVRELMQREGLRGEIVQLFHSGRTGMIHGYDGYDVTFNEESLVVGMSYSELSLGLKVSYGIFFATSAKLPSAIKCAACGWGPNRNDRGCGERNFDKSRWDWNRVAATRQGRRRGTSYSGAARLACTKAEGPFSGCAKGNGGCVVRNEQEFEA
jgi:hypothetical protein